MAKTARDLTRDELKSYRPWQNLERYRKDAEVARRREIAWGVAEKASRLLKEQYQATRVIAFGSLAHQAWFTPWSDVDLAVWGAPPKLYYKAFGAVFDLGLEAGIEVDMLDASECSPEVLKSIEKEGVEV